MAIRNGKTAPIPFQIDERGNKGLFILKLPDGKAQSDSDNGKLDSNDELVFMASDAGERGTVEGVKTLHEIELMNPHDGSRGWVYLADFASDPPALSKDDYVEYRKSDRREEIITPHYIQGFKEGHVFFNDLTILPAANGNGRNFIDKLKMRSEVRMLGGQVKVARTEDDLRSKVTGIRDGPVRVIRRNDTRMALAAGVKSPSVIVEALFNRDTFEVPSLFRLPFRVDLVATDVTYRQGVDLNKNVLGMRFYNNFSKKGVVFDGRMTPEEEAIATSPETQTWVMITGAPGTFVFHGVWEAGAPMKILAFYSDDLSVTDPPENEPGLLMLGFRIEDLLKAKNATYSFNIVNYIVPNYDGNIDSISSLIEKPIKVTVH